MFESSKSNSDEQGPSDFTTNEEQQGLSPLAPPPHSLSLQSLSFPCTFTFPPHMNLKDADNHTELGISLGGEDFNPFFLNDSPDYLSPYNSNENNNNNNNNDKSNINSNNLSNLLSSSNSDNDNGEGSGSGSVSNNSESLWDPHPSCTNNTKISGKIKAKGKGKGKAKGKGEKEEEEAERSENKKKRNRNPETHALADKKRRARLNKAIHHLRNLVHLPDGDMSSVLEEAAKVLSLHKNLSNIHYDHNHHNNHNNLNDAIIYKPKLSDNDQIKNGERMNNIFQINQMFRILIITNPTLNLFFSKKNCNVLNESLSNLFLPSPIALPSNEDIAIMRVDTTGLIIDINDSFIIQTGFQKQEICGKPFVQEPLHICMGFVPSSEYTAKMAKLLYQRQIHSFKFKSSPLHHSSQLNQFDNIKNNNGANKYNAENENEGHILVDRLMNLDSLSEEELNGPVFRSYDELIALDPLSPSLLTLQQNPQNNNDNHSIRENELLLNDPESVVYLSQLPLPLSLMGMFTHSLCVQSNYPMNQTDKSKALDASFKIYQLLANFNIHSPQAVPLIARMHTKFGFDSEWIMQCGSLFDKNKNRTGGILFAPANSRRPLIFSSLTNAGTRATSCQVHSRYHQIVENHFNSFKPYWQNSFTKRVF